MSRTRLLHFCTLIACTLLLSACQPKPEVSSLVAEPSYDASLSPQARYLLVSTTSNNLQLWDLTKKTLKYQWLHGKAGGTAIATALSDNLKYAASLSRDSVALWNMDDGQPLGWWSLPANGQCLALANNGTLLIGLTDGSVMSLNHQTDTLIKFLGHSEKVNSVALSADGRWALSGGNDNKVFLWQANTGQPLHQWQLPSRILEVSLSQDASLAFAADSTNKADIWQTQTGKPVSSLKIKRRTMNFSTARFTKDNQTLLTGTPAREVSVWRVADGKMRANWQVTRTERAQIKGAVVYSVAETINGQIISFSSNGLLETWPKPD
ncbi:WD40 repeat domain-containing protein [Shewanella spartinae]|uniref:WD40 repeat domain-containing protein n=1 Tax=Shewanella spartinae TaxID=2864205 RepID=UPI001C65AF48|nr:WD40 repeat domain-containing protein [Shewanella spartinae]QYJ94611.1 WD40 repeat domain-containing protein [Shewanella spartinae]